MRTTIINNSSTGSNPQGSGNTSPLSANSFAVLLEDDDATEEISNEEVEQSDGEVAADATATSSIPVQSSAPGFVAASILARSAVSAGSPLDWTVAELTERFRAEQEEDARALAERLLHSPNESDYYDNGDDDFFDDFDDDEDYFDDDESYTYHKARTSRPLPDLRFEQSYRKAISSANGVWWKIAYITIRDQVLFTLFQGFLWQLTLVGIRSWRMAMANNGGQWGQTFVGRLSRWWSRVNNNKI